MVPLKHHFTRATESLPELPNLQPAQPEHGDEEEEDDIEDAEEDDIEDAEEDDIEDEEEDDYEDDKNVEELRDSLSNAIDRLKQTIRDNIKDPEVKKCTKYFVTHLQEALKGDLPTLTRTLFQIGSDSSPKGVKRKNSSIIPKQEDSKSRPHYFKNGTLSCPTGGMLPHANCHWLTQS